MRRGAQLALLLALLGALVPGVGEAQPRRGGAAERRGNLGAPERREQIKKKIRALRAYTLTEELVLDEGTARRLFPMLARYDDETDRLVQKRVDLQRRLRRAETIRDPRAVDQLIDEAVANQRAFWDLEGKRIAELRKILTPVQTARVLVVLPALERRIQNQLRRAIVREGDRASDDPDDDLQPDEIPARARGRREAPLAPVAPNATHGDRSNAPGNTPPCDPTTQPCR
jgi:hypothetical protein